MCSCLEAATAVQAAVATVAAAAAAAAQREAGRRYSAQSPGTSRGHGVRVVRPEPTAGLRDVEVHAELARGLRRGWTMNGCRRSLVSHERRLPKKLPTKLLQVRDQLVVQVAHPLICEARLLGQVGGHDFARGHYLAVAIIAADVHGDVHGDVHTGRCVLGRHSPTGPAASIARDLALLGFLIQAGSRPACTRASGGGH